MNAIVITQAEWESRRDGVLWIVRPGICLHCGPRVAWHHELDCGNAPLDPPAEFVEATRECQTCQNARMIYHPHQRRPHSKLAGDWAPCPDCRIELRAVCEFCEGSAYAVGGALPILNYRRGRIPLGPCIEVVTASYVREWYEHVPDATHDALMHRQTDALAHYGDPQTLVGQYALELRVVER